MEKQDYQILILGVSVVIALFVMKYNLDNKIYIVNQKVEDGDPYKLIDTTNELITEVERLRTKVNRLGNENIELWFSRIEIETKEKILDDWKSHNCAWTDRGVQNTYFGLLIPRDYGYLRYSHSDGAVLYNDLGDAYCFDTDTKLVDCTNLCIEKTEEWRKVIEIAEEFQNGD